jgi:integrase
MDRITVYILAPADRPHYQAQWVEPGTERRRTRSLRTRNPDLAERRRADLEYELNNGLAGGERRVAWGAFRAAWFDEKLAERRPATREKARKVFDRFERSARPATLQAVDSRMLSAHAARLRKAGLAPATIHQHLAYLSSALSWAARQGMIARRPTIEFPSLPKKTHKRTIDEAQYRRLARALAGDHRLLLQVGWYTGMRRCEMLFLTWDGRGQTPRVDLKAKRVWIPAESNKARADQWLPLHPDLVKILAARRKPAGAVFGFGKGPDAVGVEFGRLCREAGVVISLHDLRRSFGTRYARHVPAQVLQRLMRHESIKTTLEFYADMNVGLEEAILKA